MAVKTTIDQFSFDNCLMNASGVYCQDEAELRLVDGSKAGTFVTKTATLEAREGNQEPRVKHFDLGSINSSGLPNRGIDYYLEVLSKFQKENPEKTYFLSVTEFSADNIHKILEIVNESDFNGLVELNLSCPNIEGKPQVGYDYETTERILEDTFTFFNKPLGVKLPPYFDMSHFDQIANILNQFPLKYVNAINSIGNGLVVEDEAVTIKPKNGFGGLGGQVVKQTALANVHALYQRLNPEIAIIGTGGVVSGRDVFEHILCGAKMVQVGTTLLYEQPAVFERLTDEFEAILRDKNYQSIEDFRGKLQYL